ncbi:MAG: ribbon-helix-helix protein, CopG family [Planctomycetia bacterium]|nr:ribbon-helix-helix protein, CopG family [Planctomycetia bacterium]
MRTAISIPDDLLVRAERFAKRTGRSRSRLFAEAVAEYLARHSRAAVKASMDALCARLRTQENGFGAAAARLTIGRSEW